ncbi:MAG: sigma-70 family RNA polymerase sigma factor [Ruminococcus sp.]|nr:sigma-70 family RNA polymerase sigma factor [Ruminococcus sp.]
MSNRKYTMKNGKTVEVSEEVYKYLLKSDRRIRYVEEDLKRNTYIVDRKNERVTVIPKREQSLDRLMELGRDFTDTESDFQDNTILKIMLEEALAKLNEKERYLIVQLFYFNRTERDLAKELNMPQRTLHDKKHGILCKLHEFLINSGFF